MNKNNDNPGELLMDDDLFPPRHGSMSLADDPKEFRIPNLVTEQEVAMLYGESRGNSRAKALLKSATKKLASYKKVEAWYATFTSKVPCVNWIRTYKVSQFLVSDLIGGVTVGIVLIVQAISYSPLAGLPPEYGLYAAIFPPLLYVVFGQARELQIGPFALVSLLILDSISSAVPFEKFSDDYVDAVLTTSVLVGILLLVLSFFRLGFITNLLAQPVVSGLSTGGALLAVTSQVPHFLGLSISSNSFTTIVSDVFANLGKVNVATFLIGLLCFLVLSCCRYIKSLKWGRNPILKYQPFQLYVVLISIIVVYFADLESKYNVQVLGELPTSFPSPRVPMKFGLIRELIIPTIIISVVGFIMAMAILKTFAEKHDTEFDSNQELFAFGLINLFGGFFLCMPTFCSLSRSALIDDIGTKTQLHGVFSALIVVLFLLLLTPYLAPLPYSALSAIVFDSLMPLFWQFSQIYILWKQEKRDMIVWVVTFLCTVLLGIAYGLFIGIGASVLSLVYTSSTSRFVVLGRFPTLPWLFKDVKRFPDVKQLPLLLVIRFDSALNFSNCEKFKNDLRKVVKKRQIQCLEEGGVLHSVILDSSSITSCDSSGLRILDKLRQELKEKNIELILCCCRGHFRDIIRRGAVPFQEYVTLQGGVAYARGKILMLTSSDIDSGSEIITLSNSQDLDMGSLDPSSNI